ncbi:hypothetical protein FRAHR75_520035 [Frankia sp. Hr75.2]|nr:hypothetical protein FRAHR75_520035 [Frankia sp. Hr75.2]
MSFSLPAPVRRSAALGIAHRPAGQHGRQDRIGRPAAGRIARSPGPPRSLVLPRLSRRGRRAGGRTRRFGSTLYIHRTVLGTLK